MSQQTSLAVAISSTSATSITVADSLGFPASGAYTILIDSEWLRVTAGNGTTGWTVTRGYGGTTAATHLISATVTLVLEAYATLGDLVSVLSLGTDTTRYALLSDLLGDVSAEVDERCSRQFYPYPVSGTTTLYWDVRYPVASLAEATGGKRSSTGIPLDILSITTLSMREDETSAYVNLTVDTDYFLEHGVGQGVAGTGWPYEDVSLNPSGTYGCWYPGKRAVRIVGAFGFTSVPVAVKRAVIAETAERFRQKISGGAEPEGVNQFGVPVFQSGHSLEWRALTRAPYAKGWSWVG